MTSGKLSPVTAADNFFDQQVFAEFSIRLSIDFNA